jgi:ATPase subunit of ABC transporter with duplicated ATPase domains
MAAQYIFQMQGLTKAYPGGKKVFENIWLSFYPDAKIGVVGVNGSGKSTLLKILAGIDTEFSGEARAADGVKMGYLEQEPHLDDAVDVYANVISACEEKRIFDRYNEIALQMAEDYSDELMEEMNALQEKIDAADLWDIDSRIEQAMDALRCPPPEWPVDKLSGAAWPWRGCSCPSPTCCSWTSRPTTWMRSRWPGCSITWRRFPAA